MIKDKFMAQMNPTMIKDATFEAEPEWMTDFRVDAFEQLASLELPQFDKIDYHTWRFVSRPNQRSVGPSEFSAEVNAEMKRYNIATVGSKTVRNERSSEMIDQAVICCDFQTAFQKYPNLIKPYLLNNDRVHQDRLNCLESSLVNNGVFIYVPKNVQLTEPINIFMAENNFNSASTFSRVVVVAETGSKCDIVQKLSSVGEQKKVTHINIDVYAKGNSNLQFFSLDSIGKANTAYVMRHATVDKHAKMNWMIGSFNDSNTISNIETDLVGEGSVGNTRIVSIANGRQQQGSNTRITNYGRHSDGEISQRGAILDHAKIVFNGIGKVAHGAHGANNQQENSVLMLSDDASGDANPILLIDENDVVAGHKASIGKIDERQLYYLMSRGIKPEIAKKLVIRGFLGIILSHIPSTSIKDQMINIIERKLADD